MKTVGIIAESVSYTHLNCIVVCNLLIVDIPGLCNSLPGGSRQNLRRKLRYPSIRLKSRKIFSDFLCHRRRKHSGVRSRVGDQLFFVELLNHPQGLVRAQLKPPGALVLQLRQVKKKGRIFLFLLSLHRKQPGLRGLFLLQKTDKAFRILLCLKTVLLIQPWLLYTSRCV